jgi:hypothetical protein
MAASGTFDGRTTEESGWTGWIAFAAVLLVLLGLFSAIEGLTAVLDDSQFLVPPSGLIVNVDYQVWGWLHLGMGVLAFVIGVCVLAGRRWALAAAAVLAGLSAIVHLAFVPALPFWAIIVIAIDIIVIYAITTHGAEMRRA